MDAFEQRHEQQVLLALADPPDAGNQAPSGPPPENPAVGFAEDALCNLKNLAEQLVFALHMIGHKALITALILPISARVSTTAHGVIGILGDIVIVVVDSLQSHQRGYKAALVSGLSMVLAFLIYFAVILVVMLGFLIGGSVLF